MTEIRDAKMGDHPAILRLLRAAFGGDEEVKIVERLWAEDAMACELAAAEGDRIIGYCALSRIDVAPSVDGDVVGLAPLAVAPERQKQGVGSALMRETLTRARANGAAAIVLVGHPEYYARFGFVAGATKNARWDAYDAGDAFQLLDFHGVFDGAPRTVRYHPAFTGG